MPFRCLWQRVDLINIGALRTPKPELVWVHLSDLGFFAVDLSSTVGASLASVHWMHAIQ